MPKVYLDEIDAALNSTTFDTLSTDSQESKSLEESLSSYINTSHRKLKGDQWNKSREKMKLYSDALKTRMELAQKLGEAIKEALTLLKDYLGEDAMLDTSQYQDYLNKRTECENSIKELQAKRNEMVAVTTTVNGVTQTHYEHAYDVGAIDSYIQQATEVLKELNRIIEKLEGLEEVYNKAMAILEEAFAGLTPFQNSVASIKPSGKFVYKPSSSSSTTTATTPTETTSTDTTTAATTTTTPATTDTTQAATTPTDSTTTAATPAPELTI